MKTRDPKTPAEWRVAAAFAQACLAIDSARQYGLITGGPGVNVGRCLEVLERAKARDVVPTRKEIDAAVDAMIAEANAGRES